MGINEVITYLMGPGEDVFKIAEHWFPVEGGKIRLRLYYPGDAPHLPILTWFHGGGWVVGSPDTHHSLCRAIANRTGACVASVDYRPAPEHKFPVAVFDCKEYLDKPEDAHSQLVTPGPSPALAEGAGRETAFGTIPAESAMA